MYLLAECITRSTPKVIGRWFHGEQKVLSMQVRMPRARARSQTALISTRCSKGLVGDSIQISWVSGRMASATACTSLRSTYVVVRPEVRLR
ncbi:hypothetical protein D3C78_1812510 [compost metagenome]